MYRLAAISVMLLATSSLATSPAQAADEWGDLSLRIVYDSDRHPAAMSISTAAGTEFCGGLTTLKTDDLLVNPKDRGVANVFVYLQEDAGKFAIHADYASSAKKDAIMANKGCAFVPKAMTMRLTQTFVGTNPDPVGHNMKVDSFDNPSFNLAVPAGGKITNTFKVVEPMPLKVTCTSHPWMAGLVLVRDDPYSAVSDASGKIKLVNLPVGKWKFRIWHERPGFIQKATIGSKANEWPRRPIEWDIKPGKNDLGDVLVKPAVFKE
jgi:hypothetical protein